MSETKSSGAESRAAEARKTSSTEPRGGVEPSTPGVRTARNAVSDTMVAVGDVVGATVQAVADVGEDVVHGVGRVALTAVNETTNVLTGIASGVRDVLAAGASGRTREPGRGP